ncbi:MAG: GAF domain-containing sensor histidine kinase, partial [Chloroflexi bacterium]|nr:GAF domain-containing sensor histidine kinase [Chloroflexota bacterium]
SLKTLERLLEVSRGLGYQVEIETYLQSLLSAAAELTESESASLLEYDEAAQEFYFRYVPWFHRDAIRSARVPLSGSVAGWVFLNVKPLVFDDVSKDKRHYKKIDELADFTTKSVLAVPLIVHGKPVGIFEVFNKKEKYSGGDILVLESLAALAATALQNEMLEKSVLSSQDEARELDRLKNEFIAITSHELRTPLGLILGHATFLKELLGNEYNEQVDSIIRNSSRLKDIIESLTSVDNHQTGRALVRPRNVSVSRIIEDVTSSFHDMARKKGIAIKKETPQGNDLWVDVDSGKIAIVLSNLVKNALTFTNENGQVIVRGEKQSDYVQISVQDNGVGIPASDLPRVFDRFYQVESHLTRRHGGMGLGLSVAKVMVEMHGGRIWAESNEGLGSTFTFLLPVKSKTDIPETEKAFVE